MERLLLTGRRPRQGGFTMVELMVTVAIAGVLAMLAAPSFSEAFLSNRLASFGNSFLASAQLARSEAIKRGNDVKMCRSADGAQCATSGGWQQGWIVFQDTDDDGVVDATETRLQYQQALSTAYSFTGNQYTLVFKSTGLSATAAALTLCRLQPSPGPQERTVTVGTTGRVIIAKTTTGTCS